MTSSVLHVICLRQSLSLSITSTSLAGQCASETLLSLLPCPEITGTRFPACFYMGPGNPNRVHMLAWQTPDRRCQTTLRPRTYFLCLISTLLPHRSIAGIDRRTSTHYYFGSFSADWLIKKRLPEVSLRSPKLLNPRRQEKKIEGDGGGESMPTKPFRQLPTKMV